MVYCATSVWIPIVSDMPQGCVMGPVLFILFTSEIFELVEYRLHAYADDSALLAVAHKPADRPAVAVLARQYSGMVQSLVLNTASIQTNMQ